MSTVTASGKITQFKHTPLDLSKAQIRLLRIYNRSTNRPGLITCTIRTFDYNESSLPLYNALSYVWGPPPPQHNILLNGRSFAIRENLWHFLSDYVAGFWRMQDTYWWIDQLCIDQEATSEKNHQVKLMSRIYKNAHLVVSWLGREKFDAALSTDQYWRGLIPIQSLRGILSKEYWTRLWVVQEVMLAKRWKLLYGQTGYDEEDIFPRNRLRPEEEEQLLPALWVRQRTFLNFRDEPPLLVTCLINFAYLQSAQSHDKIYALLGLAADKTKIIVDYDLAPTDVFWAAMKSFEDNLVIDPSGIVRIAYDMGIIDQRCIVRDSSYDHSSPWV